ncbi:EamA family transporter, partial [Candidatus Nomurabacteria bacterium CG10_big_fil_rev_8_21_14_0_10_35_16]
MHTRNKIFVGALAVVVAAVLWSLDGAFLRPRLASVSPTLVVFLEHALGFIILLPFLFIYKLELKKITRKQWGTIFWVALFGGALGTTFFTKALFLTGFVDISVVILLQKFQPIFAIILSAIILRER